MDLETSINFLRKNPNNYIEIFRDDYKQYIPSDNEKRVHLQNVPGENLESLIKSYINNNQEDVIVMIQHKHLAGASQRTVGVPYHIKVKAVNQPMQQVQQNAVPVTAEKVHEAQPVHNNGLGMPFGLGFGDIVGMTVKAERLEDVKQQLIDTKAELKEVRDDAKEDRKRLERKIEDLERELRLAKSDLAVKDKEKELAVAEVRAGQKGFLDSEGGMKVMETVSKLGEAYMVAKGMPTGEMASLGMPGTSETKSSFFEYVNENYSDEQVVYLGSVMRSMTNLSFANELTNLINKYNAAG